MRLGVCSGICGDVSWLWRRLKPDANMWRANMLNCMLLCPCFDAKRFKLLCTIIMADLVPSSFQMSSIKST